MTNRRIRDVAARVDALRVYAASAALRRKDAAAIDAELSAIHAMLCDLAHGPQPDMPLDCEWPSIEVVTEQPRRRNIFVLLFGGN